MGIAGVLSPLAGLANYNPQKKGLIIDENKKPGITDWQLTYVKSENHRSRLIEGYCYRTSLRVGESLDIFLSAERLSGGKESTTDVVIDLYRIGYYGGKGGRFMQPLYPFPVHTQPVPPIAEHRLLM